MKSFLTSILVILFCASVCSGQELVNKAGLMVTYEAAKTETVKKNDKWNVKITINNTTGTDLYFTATTGVSAIAFDAPYLRIDIPNAKGLLTLNVKYFRGKMVDGVLTAKQQAIYKIPAGIMEENFETAVAIGDTPVIKGTVMVEPLSYEVITSVQTANTPTTSPAATPAASQAEIKILSRASVGSGQKLLLNQAIEMPAAPENRLTLDATGNLVLSNDGGKTPVWTSDTAGKNVSYAEMQADGNFVLRTAAGDEIWSTDTVGNSGAMLMLGSDGSIAIYTKEFQQVWKRPE